MPKMKTHKGAKKRFKKTSSGCIVHKKAGARHLLTGMSTNRSRHLRKKNKLNKTDAKNISRFLPYA
ncbi:MAG: 50S ribosomal protein L35 [bacterium]